MKWKMAIGWLLWGWPSLPGRSYYGCLLEHATHGQGHLGWGLLNQHFRPGFRLEPYHRWGRGSPPGVEERDWGERSLLGRCLFFSTGVMTVLDRRRLVPWDMESCSQEGGVGVYAWGLRPSWLRKRSWVLLMLLFPLPALYGCGGFDDGRRLVEDVPTHQLLGGRWFGDAFK